MKAQQPTRFAPAKPEDSVAERSSRHDPVTAMVPAFNGLARWLARRYFRHFEIDSDTVTRLREMEERGAVVYVMRY